MENNMKPIVSVIIPAYNAARWIERAVTSCLKQTLDSIEVIVVDDGSSDATHAIAEKCGDERVVIVRKANGGPSAARCAGVARANGRYLAFLDADDRYEPKFLERTVEFLERHPHCCGVTTNVYWVKRDGTSFIRYQSGSIVPEHEGVVRDLLAVRIRDRGFPQIYLVLRGDWAKELGTFDPDILAGEEEELLLRWLPRGPLGYIDEPLVYYYDTPGSFIKDLKRTTHAKTVLWSKVIAQDKKLRASLPSYRKFRDHRLYRSAIISVAAGCLDEAKIIAKIWPLSPLSLHWWIGRSLVAMPRPLLWLLHKSVYWMPAVKNRNTRGF